MINLLIKGPLSAALAAAEQRKINFHSLQWRSGTNDVQAVADDGHLRAAADWYCEELGRAPFPAGTLLHYSHFEPDAGEAFLLALSAEAGGR